MAGVIHHNVSVEHLKRLRRIVHVLAALYLMSFMGGFLQATPLNFLNYVFFLLLALGGVALIRVTVGSKATGALRTFLFLTAISSIVLLVFFLPYEWARLRGDTDLAASIEAWLYAITLLFWIAVTGSLLLIRRTTGLRSDLAST